MPRIRRKNNRKHPTENKCEKRCAIYFHEFYFGVVWFNMAMVESERMQQKKIRNQHKMKRMCLFVRALNRPDNSVDSLVQTISLIQTHTLLVWLITSSILQKRSIYFSGLSFRVQQCAEPVKSVAYLRHSQNTIRCEISRNEKLAQHKPTRTHTSKSSTE